MKLLQGETIQTQQCAKRGGDYGRRAGETYHARDSGVKAQLAASALQHCLRDAGLQRLLAEDLAGRLH